jgi:pyruvate ferredoxin oxidoreductase gamma subunit
MIRIRFHGRGGQGLKTASRIVGTAAALAGRVAQDSPVYGAERRGAPMAAYVRISDAPIFERGAIPCPDLVVVADDTLLDDPAAQPLAGLGDDGILVLSTAHSEDETRAHTRHPGPVVTRDFLALALEEVGTAVGVSTALASVTCALLGFSDRIADEAVAAELVAAGIGTERVRASARLAAAARAAILPAPWPGRALAVTSGGAIVDVTHAPAWLGAPSVATTPNTRARRTGSWRVFRPVIALDRCTRCSICFAWCPDGAITLDADDTPRVDEDVCKGCLICAEECPTEAISVVREERHWRDGGPGA